MLSPEMWVTLGKREPAGVVCVPKIHTERSFTEMFGAPCADASQSFPEIVDAARFQRYLHARGRK